MATSEVHDHDRGLQFDLATLSRRRALLLLAGSALGVLAGCSPDGSTSAGSTPAGSTTSTSGAGSTTSTVGASATAAGTADCAPIPEETAGPFPGDGSNGPNVLSQNGIVRRDIRSSFGSSSTVAPGVPLTIDVVVVDSIGSCRAIPGAAVYVWHCDRAGGYSLYSSGVTGENYLRGVQTTDASGRVSFTSIFPAAYPGRWPHIHFEIYKTLGAATSGGGRVATSQIAIPKAACDEVYATAGYQASVSPMARTTLANDNVFRDDGGESQLGTISGNVRDGYRLELRVPVNPNAVSSGNNAPGTDGAPAGAPPGAAPRR